MAPGLLCLSPRGLGAKADYIENGISRAICTFNSPVFARSSQHLFTFNQNYSAQEDKPICFTIAFIFW